MLICLEDVYAMPICAILRYPFYLCSYLAIYRPYETQVVLLYRGVY